MNLLPRNLQWRFLAASLLALCLGFGSADASELVRELAAGRARKVVVYGTSLTAGGGWVGQMRDWLTANYSGTLTIINSGLSGKNSATGLSQLSSKVLAHNPDTVFIEFAVNDAFLYFDGTPQLSVEQARANLLAMVDQIQAQNPHAEIILQTMNTVWNSPNGANESATLRPNLAAYYEMYRDVAAERGLLLVDHHPNWQALQTTDRTRFETLVPDGVHPTSTGTLEITLPLLKSRLVEAVAYYPDETPAPSLIEADVCVYGGTSGAVAAAVQAARQGKRVVMLSPDEWLGGLSSNGLGWTDIGSPDAIGGIAREFYRRIYNYYLDDSVWIAETRANYVSRSGIKPDATRLMMFTFEPKVARSIFESLIADAGVTVARGRLERGFGGVKKQGSRILEITTDDGRRVIRAAMFIDATYEGDLMAAAGVSYTVGREANSQYGETLNGIQTGRAGSNQLPNGVDPYIVPGQPGSGLLPGVNPNSGGPDGSADARLQAYTFRMCLTDLAVNRKPVPQPPGYQESDYELLFRAISAGQTSRFFKTSPMPNRKTDSNNDNGFSTDFIGGNYNLAEGWNYAEASYAKREEIIAAHVRYQQGFVWALQNSTRVPENLRTSWGKYGLPLDEFPTHGGWPGQLYVREARRMVSDFVIAQQHVNQQGGFVAPDSVGMGGYAMDSHHTQRHVAAAGVKNEGDVQVSPAAGPYGISYRAIVPKSAEAVNLLVPVCLSATHIAYGSIRMEPVFMILGQSAGAAAVRAIDDGVSVQEVDYAALRRDLLLAKQVLTTAAPLEPGENVVDNSDLPEAAISGEWLFGDLTGAYKGDYRHDANTGRGMKSVLYRPTLPATGTYEVFGRWPANANRASNARFDIAHAGGTTTVLRDQRSNNNTWVSLGSYSFNAGTDGTVVIRNDDANGYVIADAVKFVLEGAVLLPGVSIYAAVPKTSEDGAAPGVFVVTRDAASASSLDVRLNYSGSATGGSDFKPLPSVVTIPAGDLSTAVSIWAFPDTLVEDRESLAIAIVPDAAYTVLSPASATLEILDPPADRWKAIHFTPGEWTAPAFLQADGDLDGISNLLEYAMGTDPRSSDASGLPEPVLRRQSGTSELRLYYPRAASDLTYRVVQSASLLNGTWTSEGVSPERYDSANGLYYRSVPVTGGDSGKFLRLEVISP